MRPLALLALLALAGPTVAFATETDLTAALAAPAGHERYRLALAAVRGTEDDLVAARVIGHRDPQIRAAAIDAGRERIADAGNSFTEGQEHIAWTLLAWAVAEEADLASARRAVQAVAESHCSFQGRVSTAVATLALNTSKAQAKEVQLEAIAALADLGDGAKAATLAKLAGNADAEVAEAARDALTSIQGKGVTDTFVRGIGDVALGDQARIALLQAATRRGMSAAASPAAQALAEPALRLEAQKAVLKLARKGDLPALRAARDRLADAPAARSALDRLIAKLEKE